MAILPRVPLPNRPDMSPEQRALYDRIVASPTGGMVGPQRANIHSPELAEAWWQLGDMLRNRTILPQALVELAIIVAGRRWNSQVEFQVHAARAAQAGIDPAVIEAIRTGAAPEFPDGDAADVYEFARQVQMSGNAIDTAYDAVLARWGVRGVVELTAVIGFYTMVCIALNLHRIPLPDAAQSPLHSLDPADDLASLSPRRGHPT
ncbi:carboxymuconolactone decarboxylase family protein [Acidisphaera sp. L21]|uniref:carboxymuconolactone decarboxylase family protein n=1 Tax=Acidisphaera sp. L21 TaxID=1641851 RepID=UPI00131CBE1A|nr:carboxymuconolactone decarboxylase family protein [Acidisphaera sp. L21]